MKDFGEGVILFILFVGVFILLVHDCTPKNKKVPAKIQIVNAKYDTLFKSDSVFVLKIRK